MNPAELSSTVLRTVRSAAAGELGVAPPARVVVERPRAGGCGDYATNAALQLAQAAGRAPLEVAALLRERLAAEPGIAEVAVTGPGFVNITLDGSAAGDLVRSVLEEGDAYGRGTGLAGRRYALRPEAGIRAAAVAGALRRLLQAAGAEVVEEREEKGAAGAGRGGGVEVVVVRPVPLPGAGAAEADGLVERYGEGALRWALLRPAAHDPVRLSGELLVRRESNPVFCVQYAHDRARALARGAAVLGMGHTLRDGVPGPADSHSAAAHPSAGGLLAAIGDLPTVVESAARHRAPDRLARHLEVLADAFLRFHGGCPALPRGDEEATGVHLARLRLAAAARIALANGLALLGIQAPERI